MGLQAGALPARPRRRGGEGEGGWQGWWGEDPPFHAPVFVLTHHPRESFELAGGNGFHFVTDELLVNRVPVVLGGGESLSVSAGLPSGTAGFELTDLAQGPEALHLTHAIRV